ncbi:hypothetical protein [Chlorogloeopsis fritschii]|uniref:hypothetical protein n=1 Tax=Chlorogloeopsis fritschii TaxID=1124 RepID=UPI0023F57921|nr:hypothetical protein [Chlorogloeopsis fritschii]
MSQFFKNIDEIEINYRIFIYFLKKLRKSKGGVSDEPVKELFRMKEVSKDKAQKLQHKF